MGEKIRDLHPIKIGRCELMIELNEAYEKSRAGRLIHIQNPHFRFLISEQGFLDLAGTVLRAKSEMDYFKKKGAAKSFEERSAHVEPGENTRKAEEHFCRELEEQEIDYRLLERNDRLLTLIIHPQSVERYTAFRDKNPGVRRCEHPYGELFQYRFLYRMRPFELLRYEDVYFEIYFRIPCMSLVPKTWIPLDKMIQQRVWESPCGAEGHKEIDPIARYIYRLCWCIFTKEGFAEHDGAYFDANRGLLDRQELRDCLEVVFFQYTPTLLAILRDGDYGSIIRSYYSFDQY